MNPYPNNPYSNPVTKPKEQENREKILKNRMGLEKPILEWTQKYLEQAIKGCDSIDSLNPDLNNPEIVVRQIASLKMLKNHLKRIKGEVEKRMKIADD